MSREPDDHRAELLRLLRGAPQLPVGSLARELGVTEPEVRGLIETLIERKRVVRDGERLIVVEPAAAPYEKGEEPVWPPPGRSAVAVCRSAPWSAAPRGGLPLRAAAALPLRAAAALPLTDGLEGVARLRLARPVRRRPTTKNRPS